MVEIPYVEAFHGKGYRKKYAGINRNIGATNER